MRWAVVACALAGCGRFGFDGRSDAAVGPGGSDAPSGDASDAMPDAFDQSAACAGYAVCDSFEGPSFTAPWMADPSVSIDTSHAHRGLHAAHAHIPALGTGVMGASQLGELTTLAGASPPATFYVRGWFFLSALPALNNRMELISIESATSSSTGDYTFVHSDDTVIYTQADTKNALAGVPPPTNTWFCVVFRVTRGTSSNGSLGLTSDVIPSVTSNNATTDSIANPIKAIWIGIGFAATNVFNAQPALDVWIDDVIVDPQPLTCAD